MKRRGAHQHTWIIQGVGGGETGGSIKWAHNATCWCGETVEGEKLGIERHYRSRLDGPTDVMRDRIGEFSTDEPSSQGMP